MLSKNILLILMLLALVIAPQVKADLIDDEPATGGVPTGASPAPSVAPGKPAADKIDRDIKEDNKEGNKASDHEDSKAPSPSSPLGSGGSKNSSGHGVLAPKGSGKSGDQAHKKKKPNDAEQPIHFASNGAKALQKNGTMELEQNVVVTQGTMRVEADYAKVFYDEATDDVAKVIAQGNIKMFKIDEDSGEKIQAMGDQATFLNKERRVTMEGNARLWRGNDLVRGKKITYEMDTGWIRADRVVGEVYPQNAQKNPPKTEEIHQENAEPENGTKEDAGKSK